MALFAFGLSIAFAHYVDKDVYGNYRFLLSLFWTLTAFTLTGLPAALTRAVAKGQEGTFRAAFGISLRWSTPMLLIAAAGSAYYFLQGNETLGSGLAVIALLGPLMQGAYLYGSYLEGRRAFRENALAGIAMGGIPAVALLISMLFIHEPALFLAVNLGTTVVVGFGISLIALRFYKPPAGSATTEFSRLSGHFSVMNVLSTISQQVDRLLVFHYLGAVELALYSFAAAVPDQMKNLFGNASVVAMPKFVQRSLKEIRATLVYRVSLFTALALVAAITYIIFAPWFFHTFFPNYVDSIFLSQLYALTLVPVGNMIPLAVLEAHAEKKKLYAFNIISPLVQIGALFIGVLGFGLIGVVVARIASRAFNLVFLMVLAMYSGARTAS